MIHIYKCPPLLKIPETRELCVARSGKPMFQGKHPVLIYKGIERKAWKKMIAKEKRKAAGRYVWP